MGFFKNIGKGLGNVFDDVKDAVGGAVDNIVNGGLDAIGGAVGGVVNTIGGAIGIGGSGSSPAPSVTNRDKAIQQVYDEMYNKLLNAMSKDIPLSDRMQSAYNGAMAYLKGAEGQALIAKIEAQINSGSNPKGGTIKTALGGLLDNVLKGLGEGLQKAVGTAIQKGTGKVTDKLFGSKPAKSLQEKLAEWFGGVVDGTWKEWLKKNWYIVLPFVGLALWVLVKLIGLLSNGSKGKRGGKGYRTK